jgi:hypothetical protein
MEAHPSRPLFEVFGGEGNGDRGLRVELQLCGAQRRSLMRERVGPSGSTVRQSDIRGMTRTMLGPSRGLQSEIVITLESLIAQRGRGSFARIGPTLGFS